METERAPARILVVDDEPLTARALEAMARHFGHEVETAGSLESAIERLELTHFDVVLTDLNLGRGNGLDLLRHVVARTPDLPVIVITGYASMDSAMEAIQTGAFDYLAKPPSLASLGAVLERAIEKRVATQTMIDAPKGERSPRIERIVGRSPQMLDVFKTVARVAATRTNVLIIGESGTGKELVARSLHDRSPRSGKRFVTVNVSAIPEGLLESELFGHVRGAFTGAMSTRIGLFKEADQGTLFLDEIGDLSTPLQAKLLRVLQEHRIKPVGSDDEIEVDVRLVAATHQNLQNLVRTGRFREDLYYRLNVVKIELPPLRERRDDIELLIDHFLHHYAAEQGQVNKTFAPEAMRLLLAHQWPGNVRELANVIERAMVLSTSTVITAESLRLDEPADATSLVTLDKMVERYVDRVLEHTGGNYTQAATILGISRRTLHRMAARKRSAPDEANSDTKSHSGQI